MCSISIGLTVIHLISIVFWLVVSVALKGDYSVVNPSMKEKNIYEAVETTRSDEDEKNVLRSLKEGVVVIEYDDTNSVSEPC